MALFTHKPAVLFLDKLLLQIKGVTHLPAKIHEHTPKRGPAEQGCCKEHIFDNCRYKNDPSSTPNLLDFWRTQNAHGNFDFLL